MPFAGKHIVDMLPQIDFSTACMKDCGTVMAAIQLESGSYSTAAVEQSKS